MQLSKVADFAVSDFSSFPADFGNPYSGSLLNTLIENSFSSFSLEIPN